MVSIGDSQNQYVSSTTTIRPPAGESWKLDWMTLYAAGTSDSIKVEITDGTTTLPWAYTVGQYISSSHTHPGYFSYGKIGSFDNSLNDDAPDDQTTTLYNLKYHTFTTSGSQTVNVWYGNTLNGGHGGMVLDNDFYLSITVTGTASGFFGLIVCATSATAIGSGHSVIKTSTADIRPGLGEHWAVIGGYIHSGIGASNSYTAVISDGTHTHNYLSEVGVNYGTGSTATSFTTTFGTMGNCFRKRHFIDLPNQVIFYDTSDEDLDLYYGATPNLNGRGINIDNNVYLSGTVVGTGKAAFNIIKIQ